MKIITVNGNSVLVEPLDTLTPVDAVFKVNMIEAERYGKNKAVVYPEDPDNYAVLAPRPLVEMLFTGIREINDFWGQEHPANTGIEPGDEIRFERRDEYTFAAYPAKMLYRKDYDGTLKTGRLEAQYTILDGSTWLRFRSYHICL